MEYANQRTAEKLALHQIGGSQTRTGRDPSLRLRWHVLQRDRFTCRACGTSPALSLGVELHVDHIVAWSKGSETVLENLQTLCSVCNFESQTQMGANNGLEPTSLILRLATAANNRGHGARTFAEAEVTCGLAFQHFARSIPCSV